MIFGRAGTGKTYAIHELILEKLKNNSPKVMLIVPEQNSFDSETALLNKLGEQFASKVNVMSFSRLVDFVSLAYGKNNKKPIDAGDRAMLMSLAMESVQDKLKIFSGNTNKVEIIDLMISALTEFKLCSVNTKLILNTSSELTNGTLKTKLYETAIILNAFDALLSQSYIDPLDNLTRLYDMLKIYEFFSDYEVFIDGFDGFTFQQVNILELILRQSRNCYMSFCTDESFLSQGFNNIDLSLFSQVNKNIKRILTLAKNNNIKIAPYKILSKNLRAKNELRFLESQIFNPQKSKYDKNVEDVIIYTANSLYDESDFICRTIKRLTINDGYRYKDFAVICRNEEVYRGILDSYMEKYNIPFFMDVRENIDSKPLMAFVLYALEIVNSNFSSDSIFKYLKTGLTDLSTSEISTLENYIFLWSITGTSWFHDFTLNPNGLSKIIDETSTASLAEINALRKKVILPLKSFEEKVKNANGKQIAASIYELLEELCVSEKLQNYSEQLINNNQIDSAKEQSRLWEILMSILDKAATILENKYVTTKRFAELLTLVIQSNDIAFIPQYVDQVTIGSADRIRSYNVKIAFVIGAVEGEFPRTPAVSGIFTDAERKKLLSLGLNLSDSLQGLALNERFLAYKAISMPCDKLFISYPSSTSQGTAKNPSSIIRETRCILKNVLEQTQNKDNLIDNIFSIDSAFELCSKHFNDYNEFSETLKSFFYNSEKYKPKMEALKRSTCQKDFLLYDKNLCEDLFGKNIRLSASKVEQFYKCKFSFFCKYALLAKERKAVKFDSLSYGTLMHFILEHIFSSFSYKDILSFDKSELYSKIATILNNYIDENLGGFSNESARFNYLLSRVKNSAVPLIIHLALELQQSNFSPADFELELSSNGKLLPLKIQLEDGTKVYIEGKIDRVDILEKNGASYVRILDYKTGTREFSLNDVLYGLNMQMLIYMAALWQNGNSLYGKVVPAGILYMPAKSSVVNANRDISEQKLESMKLKQLKMNGLLLKDTEVIMEMEKDAKGNFIPATLKNGEFTSTSSVVSLNELSSILNYVKGMISSMACDLKYGKVSSVPLVGDTNTCDFCPYKSICLFEDGDKIKEIKKIDKSKIMDSFLMKEVGESIDKT